MDVTNELREKVVKDFQKYLKRLENGYRDDYSGIINTIYFLENCNSFTQEELLKYYECLIEDEAQSLCLSL